MNDKMTAEGWVRVFKTDNASGEVIYDKWFKNQITNYARQQAALAWGQSVNAVAITMPSMISVGTGAPPSGTSGTTANDTALWGEVSDSRKSVDYAQQWLQYYTQFSVTYQQTEVLGTVDPSTNPTGTINLTEAGLWDSQGNLFSHVALNGVTHDNTSTLSIQWQVEQQGN